jgi:hypothetical protein
MPEANDEPYIAPDVEDDLDAIIEEEAEIPPAFDDDDDEEAGTPPDSKEIE